MQLFKNGSFLDSSSKFFVMLLGSCLRQRKTPINTYFLFLFPNFWENSIKLEILKNRKISINVSKIEGFH